ncbi:alveolar macrophage chemotactic factor-like [Paramormyrops kingsleyae]|uniref:alveolar macrophage chemotactic factor-like n=1 Tax=Paramormyrops kingsleyae TaxID=1676925 RepID=UPI000CD641A7|nr:alveolar macrophage chemotactic factor-like [Paramormyrops kingsleyae]
MDTRVLLVLLGAAVLLVHETHSLGMGHIRDCMCQKYESRLIPAGKLRRVEIFPRGPHCFTSEVLATLVGGEKVCLNPRVPWVKRVIQKVLEKRKQK